MIYFYIIVTLLLITLIVLMTYLKEQKMLKQSLGTMMDEHVSEVETMYKMMRSIRHDYINQLQVLKALNLEDKKDELNDYLNLMDHELNQVETIVRTGHVTVDAIINSKLSLAKEKGIELNVRALIPSELSVSHLDMGILLNNLLSNAMEASLKSDTPFIRFYMAPIKNNLYISCTNSSEGKVSSLTSTKSGDHGYGSGRISSVVKKYDGWISRESEQNVFNIEIYLPLVNKK